MIELALESAHQSVSNGLWWISKQQVLVEIQAYQCSVIISYLLKLAWQLPSGMSFDHVMATACAQTITLLYIYLCVWELDFRLNNINYSYWYFPSSIIITSLYWTSEIPLSSSITTSEYLICDICPRSWWITEYPQSWNHCGLPALSEICWCAMFPHSWF